MADYKFYLKDRNADKETQIRMHIHYNNQIAKVYIGEKIHPESWNSVNMRAKQTKKFPEHPEFNERLEDAVLSAKRALDLLRKENNGHYPTPKVLSKQVRIEIGLEKGKADIDLFHYFDKRSNEEETRLKTKGNKIHSGSFPRGLKRTRDLLLEYQEDTGKRVSFETIDLSFYYDFLDYMRDEKGYRLNTMGKHIKLLKNIMRTALSEGIHDNMAFTHPKFKILEEEGDAIYLDEDDLNLLGSLNLDGFPGLVRVRDLFLAGCWSGVRYGDWRKLSYNNAQGDDIVIKTQKTGKEVRIPILPPLRRILDKYADIELPTLTNQAMNRSLKELGKKMQEKSKLKSLDDEKSKYLRISTHTARRSFATNLYRKGVPIESIMQVTGHKTQQEFYKYIRMTPGEHTDNIRQFYPSSSASIQSAN
jgi:site-specific recombinase XerD